MNLGDRPLWWRGKSDVDIAIGALEPVVKPLDAALLMEHVIAVGQDLYLLLMLEGLQTNRAILVLVKNILI